MKKNYERKKDGRKEWNSKEKSKEIEKKKRMQKEKTKVWHGVHLNMLTVLKCALTVFRGLPFLH